MMKYGLTALLALLFCLLLCSCSMLDRVSSIGSKDKTGARSKEDWNSSSQSVSSQDDLSLPDEEDGEVLALPDDIPDRDEDDGEEEPAPAPEDVPDITGTWTCRGDSVTGVLEFSGSSVTYTLTQEGEDTVYEGSFVLSGGLLSLSLFGGGADLSPSFFFTLENDSRMTLEIIGGETLPGLNYVGDSLVFTLS